MTITYRPGTSADSFAVFQVFNATIMDYSERKNVEGITGGSDPEVLQSLWQKRKPMFEFLARTAAQFWVAEREGRVVGYARSVEHDSHQELTEFFVSPDQQSAGVGGELLSRAFSPTSARYRCIIATLDERALYRYMKMGVYGRFSLNYFHRKAEKVDVPTDLKIEPLQLEQHIEDLNRIDRAIVGHGREVVHQWIAATRDGFIYKRNGNVVGYGYVGSNNGPFALRDDHDFPAILAHAESLLAAKGEEFGAETPLINTKAIQYFT